MHVRLANPADLPDITTCFIAAFETDAMSDFLHPYRHKYPESYRKFILNDRKQRYLAPGGVVVVAETDSEDLEPEGRKQIVGSAFWHRWGVDESALKQQNMKDSYARAFERFLVSVESKYSAFFHLNRSLHAAHLEAIMGDTSVPLKSERWHLHGLGVDPHFQGKGIGKMLVDEGKERAGRDGVCIQLICGDDIKKWYERRGLVEVVRFPAGKLETELGRVAWLMGWNPETTSEGS